MALPDTSYTNETMPTTSWTDESLVSADAYVEDGFVVDDFVEAAGSFYTDESMPTTSYTDE